MPNLSKIVYYSDFKSPIGKIFIAKNKKGIFKVSLSKKDFFKELKDEFSEVIKNKKEFKNLLLKLDQYFRGFKINFDFKVDLSNLTPFEQKVLLEVKKIPYGKTKTYQEIARAISEPNAWRAVGKAISKNPLPLIIPCHRVIGKNKLGGFIFGKKIKKYLLELEKC